MKRMFFRSPINFSHLSSFTTFAKLQVFWWLFPISLWIGYVVSSMCKLQKCISEALCFCSLSRCSSVVLKFLLCVLVLTSVDTRVVWSRKQWVHSTCEGLFKGYSQGRVESSGFIQLARDCLPAVQGSGYSQGRELIKVIKVIKMIK